MMPNKTCANCGTEMMPEAKFCRWCGQPTTVSPQGSVTEATTRLLETPERPPASGPDLNGPQGTLAYQPPSQFAANNTSRNLTAPNKSNSWLLVSLLIVALVAICSVAAAIKIWSHAKASVQPPVVSIPEPPPPPEVEPPDATDSAGVSSELYYPGAKTIMQINKSDGGSMLQLQTPDSVDKVEAWYRARMHVEKVVKMPGSNVILEGDEVKAIINATGNGTNIFIKEGED